MFPTYKFMPDDTIKTTKVIKIDNSMNSPSLLLTTCNTLRTKKVILHYAISVYISFLTLSTGRSENCGGNRYKLKTLYRLARNILQFR